VKFIRLTALLALLCTMLVLADAVTAQSYDATAFWEMDVPPEGGWHVGDLIPLRLRVMTPQDVNVSYPELPAQWETFEIRDQVVADPQIKGERKYSVLEITVQLWDVGVHVTPSTTVVLLEEGKEPSEMQVRELQVEINSVLPEENTNGEIDKHDLKPQAVLPRPPIWPWFLAAAVAAPLLFLGGRWLWQKLPRRNNVLPAEIMPIPGDNQLPEDIAYACLDRIARMDLPGIGAFKQHYSMVADCIRQYLLGIYGIPAMDMTTTELKRALRRKHMELETQHLLWDLFEQADMVKFAKYVPEVAEARNIIRWGKHFVDCTKPNREPLTTELMVGE
jgi:hypothetical protein